MELLATQIAMWDVQTGPNENSHKGTTCGCIEHLEGEVFYSSGCQRV